MITIGIDVGITGAIAALDSNGQVLGVRDLPVMVSGRLKWIDGVELLTIVSDLRNGQPARAVLEFVHAIPKLGCTTANSMGLTVGSTLAALQIAGLSIELVAPQTWKRALGLLAPGTTDKAKKDASLSKARLLFPTANLGRVKDHNRAEACLIAHWGFRSWSGVQAAA